MSKLRFGIRGCRPGKLSLSLFAKYFLSYMLIFLIPFVAISALFYMNSVDSLRHEIVRSNIHKLEQVRDMTDLQMGQLANMAMTISFDHRLTPYMVRHPHTDKQAIEELQRHRANSALIDNLILYYLDSDDAYSPGGSGSLDTLLNHRYPVGGHYEGFKTFLRSVSHPMVLPALEQEAAGAGASGGRGQFVTYVVPISFNQSSPYGVVLFLIRESVLSDLIGNILGDFHGNVYIFNDRHEILASMDNGNPIGGRHTSRLMQNEAGVADEQIDGRRYSVVIVPSKTSGRSFVAAIPTAQFYGKVADLQFFVVNLLALTALVGLGTAVYLTFRQYKPIRSLSRYLGSRQRQPQAARREQDEFTRIRDSFDSLFQDSEQLRAKVSVQQPFVRDQCLLRLLQGDADRGGGQELASLLHDLQLPINGPYYFAAVLSLGRGDPNSRSPQSREKALRLLAGVSSQEGVGYGVELIHAQAIALIVCLNASTEPRRQQRQFIDMLAQRLREQEQMRPTIGVGHLYDSLNRINRSFIEATAAMQYTLVNGQGCVIYFDEIAVQSDETSWYPDAEKMKFMQSLKQGDFAVAREALKTMTGGMLGQEVSIELVKCMCFEVINAALRTMSDLGMHPSAGKLKTLVAFRSVEELEEAIQELMVDICEEVRRQTECRHHKLRDEVLGYIRQRYAMHELSLETAAEAFQLSVSYLSRLVKEQTGTTFTQLVWQLRLEEAKRQLRQTDKPIKDIVAAVGYMDVANFISRFRKAEGVTPGQYREQHASPAPMDGASKPLHSRVE